MLPRQQRLRNAQEFSRVFRQGKAVADARLLIKYRPNGGAGSRMGISVSRRLGKAVQRNHIKRLLREAARSQLNDLQPSCDLVVVAREPVRDASLAAVSEAMRLLLTRARLRCSSD